MVWNPFADDVDPTSHAKENLAALEGKYSTKDLLRGQVALLRAGRYGDLVEPNSITDQDILREIAPGALADKNGLEFFAAARDQLNADIKQMEAELVAAEQSGAPGAAERLNAFRSNVDLFEAKKWQGLDQSLAERLGEPLNPELQQGPDQVRADFERREAALLQQEAPPPMTTAAIVTAEKAEYDRNIRPEIEAGLREAGIASPPSLSAAAATAPAGLTADEAQAWQAFDAPNRPIPAPESHPTVDQQVNGMAAAPAAIPLAPEPGGQQGQSFATAQSGDSLWTMSKEALVASGVDKPTDTQIANYTTALAEKNNIEIGRNGVANIQEGQRINLLDSQPNSPAAPAQDNATWGMAAAEPPPAPAPATPASPAPAATEAAQEENAAIKKRAMDVAGLLNLNSAASLFHELAGVIGEYVKNAPSSVADREQGTSVAMTELGTLPTPNVPNAKGVSGPQMAAS